MATPLDESGFLSPDAEQLLQEGRSLLRRGHAVAALGPLRCALDLWQDDTADTRSLAECHAAVGWALQLIHQANESLEHLQAALRLFEGLEGTERDRANCSRGIGQALGALTRYEEAVAQQECALK